NLNRQLYIKEKPLYDNTMPKKSRTEELDIFQIIKNINDSLADSPYSPNEMFGLSNSDQDTSDAELSSDETFDEILDEISNGYINLDTILELNIHFISKTDSSELHERSAKLYLIYYAMASIAHTENKNDIAWSALSKANYYKGIHEGIRIAMNDPKLSRASKGGRAKAEKNKKNTQTIIDTVLSGLVSEKPTHGWSSPYNTSNALLPYVQQAFIDSTDTLKEPKAEDLRETIQNLLKIDPQVNELFTSLQNTRYK
ncbi:MAG: hypothetical protein U9N57_04815, partial [Pseudomonadota bacterium]|nr:hypothetical protein [Pseudomonadota bacterium]